MPLWKSIVQKFDWSGKPKDQTEVEGSKAVELLEQVDMLLDESLKMLVSAKPALSDEELNMFEDRHSELYLAVVAVRTDARDRKDQDNFFLSPEEKTEFYTEVQKLLRQCQSYHRDVLTTSQRARLNKSRLQLKDVNAPASPAPEDSGSSLNTSWVAVAPTGSLASGETLQQLAENSGSSESGLPYLANVIHIPQSALATEQELLSKLPDDDHYYRLMICGNRLKRVVILDPNPQPIKKEAPPESDSENDAERPGQFFKVGDMFMKNDPQDLEEQTKSSSYEAPSLATSIFSFLLPNPSNLGLGGMV